MVSNINNIKSHPDKLLSDHTKGVIENVRKLTDSKLAELVSIFHDLGKINPNFQNKLLGQNKSDYSNHSYFSAFAFFCAFACQQKNKEFLQNLLNRPITKNDIILIVVLIAKHHGNIPDLSPSGTSFGNDISILSKEENKELFNFINNNDNLFIYEFIKDFIKNISNFNEQIKTPQLQETYNKVLIFDKSANNNPLDFFLDAQFAFASLIQADKADAANLDNFIDKQKQDVISFCEKFNQQLTCYLSKLNQDTELNKIRTKIRLEAVNNIKKELENEKTFELTAPTGSGKTLMMLSLANKIIETKGAKRIIYALPFLSITEQVETEMIKIFSETKDFVQRVDSKSQNIRFESIQKELENNPSNEKIIEANLLEFQENTFAYPFVITTFVRFFETLLSNKNSELLKLPNFSNCIFILDEIQALPPRLYGFFIAYLDKFCKKFNSYAIISTATQPNFKLPNNEEIKTFFSDYFTPTPLLSLDYFKNDLFNRYTIELHNNLNELDIETLKDNIISENKSVLVILNTIKDTTELYEKLKINFCKNEIILLNTHFTPQHRKIKIYLAKRKLRENKKIIVISTQLIEAGVDIDFPIVYRDFTTVSSIIQSAGRCNRNGKLKNLGIVKLFKLTNNGKISSELIYRGKDSEILRFTKEALSCNTNTYEEKDLIKVQESFFTKIQKELNFAKHSQNKPKIDFDFLKDIKECQFKKIGNFRLIDEQFFGEERRYYVAKNNKDNNFENLLELQDEFIVLLKNNTTISQLKTKKHTIEHLIKKMSNQILQIRFNSKTQTEPILADNREYFNLKKISNSSYSFETGIDVIGKNCIL